MLLCCGKLPDSEKDPGGRGPLFCARTQGLARGTRGRWPDALVHTPVARRLAASVSVHVAVAAQLFRLPCRA
jgi:hypothetical protein